MTSSTNAHRNQKILFFKKPKSPSSSFDGAGPFFFCLFGAGLTCPMRIFGWPFSQHDWRSPAF
jgi:hypothetical protein